MNRKAARLRSLAACAILLLTVAMTTSAHHSNAMFDSQKTVTLTGTVKEFRWTNPHCWIQLLVPKNGVNEEWSVEMGSTTQLFRSGWRPRTIKEGDKLEVVVHPLRDGTLGALFLSAQGPAGIPGKTSASSTP
jgi:uncharacterized protein DUF6152